ncbi:hypothetical protein QUF72_18360 [Desulfobacterales bacterium HSG2]|nr:hypothetical protein [Desulfobacterales bacterium HSG2]
MKRLDNIFYLWQLSDMSGKFPDCHRDVMQLRLKHEACARTGAAMAPPSQNHPLHTDEPVN